MYRRLAPTLLVLLALCAPARAQVIGAQPASYQPLVSAAAQAFSRGNYREALELFRDANERWPNALALRAIGGCLFGLADYVEAHAALEQALRSKVRPLDPTQRSETAGLLGRVREHVARYVIVTSPATARVSVDGAYVTLDESGHIAVTPGAHTLEASATGYTPARRELQADAGSLESVVLRLIPLAALAPTPMQVVPARPSTAQEPSARSTSYESRSDAARPHKPLRKKWWVWSSVAGAVVASGIVAAVLVLHDKPGPARPEGGSTGIAISVPRGAQP